MKILLALLAACAVLFGAEPKFGDYPAKTYKGDISKTAAKQFGQELKINFGGKYYINYYACWNNLMECDSDVVIVDVESGETSYLVEKLAPYSHGVFFYNHDGFRFRYQADSYLLSLWYLEENVDIDKPYRKVYFTFKDGEFTEIAKVETYPDDFLELAESYNVYMSFEGVTDDELSEEEKRSLEESAKYREVASKKLLEKYKNNKKVLNQIKLFMKGPY
jgi:hypothetical protein